MTTHPPSTFRLFLPACFCPVPRLLSSAHFPSMHRRCRPFFSSVRPVAARRRCRCSQPLCAKCVPFRSLSPLPVLLSPSGGGRRARLQLHVHVHVPMFIHVSPKGILHFGVPVKLRSVAVAVVAQRLHLNPARYAITVLELVRAVQCSAVQCGQSV
ncbi:hypothetical protein LX32DRAFT_349186 [Colletotrichum zoysiae]|uniref:Uncharacterized protein n=1 Tax=Colletotrichum zoysiae TaxID=1216348 RepID=A0AAD9HJZ6_9PEZI|nr:hypothetical protein LX32DRAFT_349186 [Colletotrichum zoysiae]